jgi:sec-independent protein translocase protein TatB
VFDVAFSELVVIAVVALIVIGPEKLPKVARTLGFLAGRLQRYVTNVKAEIEREMQFEDLQKLQQEIKNGVMQAKTEVEQVSSQVQHQIHQQVTTVEQAINPNLGSVEATVEHADVVADPTNSGTNPIEPKTTSSPQ